MLQLRKIIDKKILNQTIIELKKLSENTLENIL